jgi:hypothetical protein
VWLTRAWRPQELQGEIAKLRRELREKDQLLLVWQSLLRGDGSPYTFIEACQEGRIPLMDFFLVHGADIFQAKVSSPAPPPLRPLAAPLTALSRRTARMASCGQPSARSARRSSFSFSAASRSIELVSARARARLRDCALTRRALSVEQDKGGLCETALIVAVQGGDPQTVEMLLKRGTRRWRRRRRFLPLRLSSLAHSPLWPSSQAPTRTASLRSPS